VPGGHALKPRNEEAPRERAIVVTVVLGTILVPLNSTMIAVALPRVIAAFDASLSSAGWLVTGYLIAMASLQPVGGRLGDRIGRRPLVLGGLALFAAASLAAGVAPDLQLLILFRILQGVAGALVFPNAIALLREFAPPGKLAGRLGLVGAALPLAAAAGPLVGGVLLALGSWRTIFLLNLPLLVVPLVLGWRVLPRREREQDKEPFDVVGAILLSMLLSAGAWVLIQGLDGIDGFAALAVAGAAAPLLLVQELRHPKPLLLPRLFTQAPFVAANGGVALSNLAMYVTLFSLPVLLGRRGGWTSAGIGLALAALSLATFLFSPIGGRLAERLGHRAPGVLGLTILTASLVPLAVAPATISRLALVALLVSAGVGLGLSSAPLQAAALESVEVAAAGVASGIFSTSRYLGSITGTALLAGPLTPAVSGFGGFGALFWTLVAAAAGSAALALALPGRTRPAAGDGDAAMLVPHRTVGTET
jgi:EmrB/QacA subfamily drug resistance transporter